MKRTDVLVVGGGICGYTAALAARRYYGGKKITLVRKEVRALIPWCLAYNCAKGTLSNNVLRDDRLYDEGIELVIDEVTAIDRQGKCVTTAFAEDIIYDKLILATGSLPATPFFKGADLQGVFALKKEFPYLENIRASLASARSLVIVGAGPAGIEFAEACTANRQLKVTMVELLPHCLAWAFDDEFCTLVEENLRQRGINIITAAGVEELQGNKRVEQVKLTSGRTLPADMVILATGVVPNTRLAREAGLATHEHAGILVDEYMRTSDEDIFAVGDCAAKISPSGPGGAIARQAIASGREARVAAANLFALKRPREIALEKFSVTIGDHAFGSVGLIQRTNPETGREMLTVDIAPGVIARDVAVKVAYARETGATIGAQVHGKPLGLVREIIDRLATAIQHQARFDELALA
ncbi:Nitric oxide reductase FlRd-NAD(+) reductase [Neomoorella glycerini]|uniref:Nitric oxide reductase FlRd-NAD(+) reductase n=1 Tax=Neomoorella glycerini TaxID=55779 RepID=A0A6I5ZWH3_9FIRM|nr:NAD(P)/FAD-dependent oxidoreductase [Moorella glycerini]QGP93995.1 Nitric oxide reductase FlRd-NAD(+) reductase [Moorella glycerini]